VEKGSDSVMGSEFGVMGFVAEERHSRRFFRTLAFGHWQRSGKTDGVYHS
jgi:hypothetical protein